MPERENAKIVNAEQKVALAGSVTSVTTTGLDEDIEFNDTSEDPWEFAW